MSYELLTVRPLLFPLQLAQSLDLCDVAHLVEFDDAFALVLGVEDEVRGKLEGFVPEAEKNTIGVDLRESACEAALVERIKHGYRSARRRVHLRWKLLGGI